MMMEMMEIMDASVQGILIAMPVEVWYWIISFLEARDMIVMSAVSRALCHVPKDDVLWKRLCFHKLGTTGPLPSVYCLWRDFYAKHKCYPGAWDTTRMGKIQISEDRVTATHGGDFLGSYQCVRGTEAINSVVCYWEISIDKLSPHQTGFHIVLGVVPQNFSSFNTYLTSNGGMGYLADGRKACNSGNGEQYGQKFVEGDRVGVLLDMIHGTLTFYLNGVSQGIAYNNVTGPMYPAASLLTGGQKITLHTQCPFPQIS